MAKPAPKKTVYLAFLGLTFDRRDSHWRPNLEACRALGKKPLEFWCFFDPSNRPAAAVYRDLKADILKAGRTGIRFHTKDPGLDDPWEFESVYQRLWDLFSGFDFDPETDYLVSLQTGTHIIQIVMFLLLRRGVLPGRLVQVSPPARRGADTRVRRTDVKSDRFERLLSHSERAENESFLKDNILTRNKRYNTLINKMESVARMTREPILLLGPSGAGKTRLARRIYELKKNIGQLKGKFQQLNCAEFHGDLIQSQLFGHKKGSFTGATTNFPGHLREADGGLLFLDEIGDLSLENQARLLKALDEKSFYPLGSTHPVTSNFQIICGTNHSLAAKIQSGEFRVDFYHRLSTWRFTLPSLAERKEDIEANLDFELSRLATESKTELLMTRDARRLWLRFARSPEARWLGNFRDLRQSVRRMSDMAPGGVIDRAVANDEVRRLKDEWEYLSQPATTSVGKGSPWTAPKPAEISATGDKFAIVEKALGPNLRKFTRLQQAELELILREAPACRTMKELGERLYTKNGRAPANPGDNIAKKLKSFGLRWEDVRECGGWSIETRPFISIT